jgi:acyl-coenzyme A synthetase/AMP-(fatty) acid ligase
VDVVHAIAPGGAALVADAAVVGRPDAITGEAPVAVVVAREALDAQELMAWVAGRVAPYKRIRAVRFADAIPRTPAGKILRRVLIEEQRQAVSYSPSRQTGRWQ